MQRNNPYWWLEGQDPEYALNTNLQNTFHGPFNTGTNPNATGTFDKLHIPEK